MMTVKELKKLLENFDEDMIVVGYGDCDERCPITEVSARVLEGYEWAPRDKKVVEIM